MKMRFLWVSFFLLEILFPLGWADGNALQDQIKNLKRDSWEVLERSLQSSTPIHRVWALEALGKMGWKETVPFILKAIQDKDSFVRSHAAWALGQIREKETIPQLALLLRDPH